MRLLRFVPDNTSIDFIGRRRLAFLLSALLLLASLASLAAQGLNLGIDFQGGILLEVAGEKPFDLGALRSKLHGLGLGDVSLQGGGRPADVLIRIEAQPGGAATQDRAVAAVKTALGSGIDYRRVEIVGPTVSGDLLMRVYLAALLAVLAIAAYAAFRFCWQFAAAIFAATLYDVVTTMGVFSLLRLEFNLISVAALLVVAGYSVNDTVVLFDRIRENMRKYATMDYASLFNLSINETLSRTVMLTLAMILAVIALLALGGSTLEGFAIALAWGIVTGAYSTVYVAAVLLLRLRPRRLGVPASATAGAGRS